MLSLSVSQGSSIYPPDLFPTLLSAPRGCSRINGLLCPLSFVGPLRRPSRSEEEENEIGY